MPLDDPRRRFDALDMALGITVPCCTRCGVPLMTADFTDYDFSFTCPVCGYYGAQERIWNRYPWELR